jgi:hypothetical protein
MFRSRTKKWRCCKINTNDNIVERKFNQVTTDRQWRKHSRAHERAFEGLRADTRSHFIYPRIVHTRPAVTWAREILIRGQIFLLHARKSANICSTAARVGDLSCQKTLCGVLRLKTGAFRLFQLMQMSKEHPRVRRGDHRGINKSERRKTFGQWEKKTLGINYIKLSDSIYFAPVITLSIDRHNGTIKWFE